MIQPAAMATASPSPRYSRATFHQDNIEWRLGEGGQRLFAIVGNLDRATQFAQHHRGNLLVGQVVFGQQNAQIAQRDGGGRSGQSGRSGRACFKHRQFKRIAE